MDNSAAQPIEPVAPLPSAVRGISGRQHSSQNKDEIGLADALHFASPWSVHLWSFTLDKVEGELESLKRTLSSDELERAARFRFEQHQNRYTTAHGRLREILGQYLSKKPQDLEFEFGPQGKPSMAASVREKSLQFNLSHSDEIGLLAISPTARVGVDVEKVRTLPDAGELVDRFFSKREAELFSGLPAGQKDLAFFNLWTRKESWLKATGEGIAHLLAHVEVSFLPGESSKLLELPHSYAGHSSWSLSDFVPAEGFVGAVAVEADELRPLLRSWDDKCEGGLNES